MTVVLNLDRQISVARVKTSKKSVTVEEISNYPYEAQQFFESNELRMMIREMLFLVFRQKSRLYKEPK